LIVNTRLFVVTCLDVLLQHHRRGQWIDPLDGSNGANTDGEKNEQIEKQLAPQRSD